MNSYFKNCASNSVSCSAPRANRQDDDLFSVEMIERSICAAAEFNDPLAKFGRQVFDKAACDYSGVRFGRLGLLAPLQFRQPKVGFFGRDVQTRRVVMHPRCQCLLPAQLTFLF